MSDRIRVLVAENSRIHMQLLSNALERDPSLEVIGWDGDRSTLIAVALDQAVDVVVLSSAFGGSFARSMKIVRDLRMAAASTKVVVLLDSQNKEEVIDAFRAGAKGIFSRDGSIELFHKCMRRVYLGEIWADTWEVGLAIDALASAPMLRTEGKSGVNLLSKRELEVVQCLVQGMTNREIANQMGLSQHTVKNYLFRVFDKLGVSSRTELLFMTLNQGQKSEDSVACEVFQKAFDGEPDGETLAFVQKAANKGLPSAQLALAQMFFKRRFGPDDLVLAYAWLLVAGDSSEQLRTTLATIMTPSQTREAEQKARTLSATKQRNTPPAETSFVKKPSSQRLAT